MGQPPICRHVQDAAIEAISSHSMWRRGDPVVVAVSGGADSLCLLHLLRVRQTEHGGALHLAHLDHQFRGPASAAEAAQVAALARQWGLPATIEAIGVPSLAEEQGLSAETAARQARYRFLAGVAAAAGAPVIALGHTADDQVETVLMHLIRGAGLSGLRGMRPLAPAAPWMTAGQQLPHRLQLARPLLQVSRADTAAYCAACGLSPAEDPWNVDPQFLRTRLRQEVLPLLEDLNPAVRGALLRLARLASWLDDDLQLLLDSHWPDLAALENGVCRLDLDRWAGLPQTLRLLALRRAVEAVRGHLEGVGWEALTAAGRLGDADVGSQVALVQDLLARRDYDALSIGPQAALDRTPDWPDLGKDPTLLKVPGRTPLPGGAALTVTMHPQEEACWDNGDRWSAWVDADRCGQRLWLRHRRPGDRFQPLGMEGHKTLQDLFVDEKVPRAQRERVPLVLSARGIVWVVGYRLDGRFRVRPQTGRVLHLRWEQPAQPAQSTVVHDV